MKQINTLKSVFSPSLNQLHICLHPKYLSKKSSNSFSWRSICQMTDIEGAVLVRPDEHIAWRLKSGLDGDPILETRRVFFCNIEGRKQTCIEDIGSYLCVWGEVLHLKPRLHRCCVYFELECRILISSSLSENISDSSHGLVVCRTCRAPDSSHGCQSSRILPASV